MMTEARVLPHKIRLTPVSELKPHPRNARKHADSSIDESIALNGVFRPVVASSKSGYILAGHGLASRAKAAGIEKLPVMWIDGLDEAAELRILSADNRTADLAAYDEKALAELLSTLRTEAGSIAGSGFDQGAIDEIIDQAANDYLRTAKKQARTLRKIGREATKPEESDEAPPPNIRFTIVVRCQDEAHQASLLERFHSEGLTCEALAEAAS